MQNNPIAGPLHKYEFPDSLQKGLTIQITLQDMVRLGLFLISTLKEWINSTYYLRGNSLAGKLSNFHNNLWKTSFYVEISTGQDKEALF